VEELSHVLQSIGEKLSPAEVEALSKEADPEGKGTVQEENFIRVGLSLVPVPACEGVALTSAAAGGGPRGPWYHTGGGHHKGGLEPRACV